MYNNIFYKYLLVGSTTVILDYAILYFTFSILSMGKIISLTLAYLVSGVFNFFSQKYFTFQSTGKYQAEILKYSTLALLSYLITILLVSLLTFYEINIYVAKLIATCITFVFVYVINDKVVYNIRVSNDSH